LFSFSKECYWRTHHRSKHAGRTNRVHAPGRVGPGRGPNEHRHGDGTCTPTLTASNNWLGTGEVDKPSLPSSPRSGLGPSREHGDAKQQTGPHGISTGGHAPLSHQARLPRPPPCPEECTQVTSNHENNGPVPGLSLPMPASCRLSILPKAHHTLSCIPNPQGASGSTIPHPGATSAHTGNLGPPSWEHSLLQAWLSAPSRLHQGYACCNFPHPPSTCPPLHPPPSTLHPAARCQKVCYTLTHWSSNKGRARAGPLQATSCLQVIPTF